MLRNLFSCSENRKPKTENPRSRKFRWLSWHFIVLLTFVAARLYGLRRPA